MYVHQLHFSSTSRPKLVLILQDKSPFNRICLTAWLNLNDWCVNSSLILQKSHFSWVLSRWAYQQVLVLSCSPTEFSLRDFRHVLSSNTIGITGLLLGFFSYKALSNSHTLKFVEMLFSPPLLGKFEIPSMVYKFCGLSKLPDASR